MLREQMYKLQLKEFGRQTLSCGILIPKLKLPHPYCFCLDFYSSKFHVMSFFFKFLELESGTKVISLLFFAVPLTPAASTCSS